MKALLSVLTLLLLLSCESKAQSDSFTGSWVALRMRVLASEGDTVRTPAAQVLHLRADGDTLRGLEYILLEIPEVSSGEVTGNGQTGASQKVVGTYEGQNGLWTNARLTLTSWDGTNIRSYIATVYREGERLRLTPDFGSGLEPTVYFRVPSID